MGSETKNRVVLLKRLTRLSDRAYAIVLPAALRHEWKKLYEQGKEVRVVIEYDSE